MGFLKINWDALGIATSVACAIHCAVLPLLVTTFPLFGVNIINNLWFEYGMILLAFAIGSSSLWHGYKRHHHSFLPIGLFGLGMIGLLLKQLLHEYQLWFLVPSVGLIVAAHFINFRYCRNHNHAHSTDCNH
jgi:hypothetical protein